MRLVEPADHICQNYDLPWMLSQEILGITSRFCGKVFLRILFQIPRLKSETSICFGDYTRILQNRFSYEAVYWF